MEEHMKSGQNGANQFGLYDMLGNVREWVADWHWMYQGEYNDGGRKIDVRSAVAPACPCPEIYYQNKVIRGCGWNDKAMQCRLGFRFSGYHSGEYNRSRWENSFGFRILRELHHGNHELPRQNSVRD